MTMDVGTDKTPMWLKIEEQIVSLGTPDLAGDKLESEIQRMAGALDNSGINVSRNAGNMLQLRAAVTDTATVGRPFLNDFNEAVGALTLDDVIDPYAATVKLINQIGETWPRLKGSERKPDVMQIVERKRLDLLIAKAKETCQIRHWAGSVER